jgi:hypothetical protein
MPDLSCKAPPCRSISTKGMNAFWFKIRNRRREQHAVFEVQLVAKRIKVISVRMARLSMPMRAEMWGAMRASPVG